MLHNSDRASEILLAEVEKINVSILVIEYYFVYKNVLFILQNVQKSSRLLLQLIEIKMSDNPMNISAVVKLIDSILVMKSIDVEQQVIFAQRKVEFLEEFGKDILL